MATQFSSHMIHVIPIPEGSTQIRMMRTVDGVHMTFSGENRLVTLHYELPDVPPLFTQVQAELTIALEKLSKVEEIVCERCCNDD
jgi:hypothetical protein